MLGFISSTTSSRSLHPTSAQPVSLFPIPRPNLAPSFLNLGRISHILAIRLAPLLLPLPRIRRPVALALTPLISPSQYRHPLVGVPSICASVLPRLPRPYSRCRRISTARRPACQYKASSGALSTHCRLRDCHLEDAYGPWTPFDRPACT